jgi:hypothetical protein
VCCGLLLLVLALVLPQRLLLLLQVGCGWDDDAHRLTIRLDTAKTKKVAGSRQLGSAVGVLMHGWGSGTDAGAAAQGGCLKTSVQVDAHTLQAHHTACCFLLLPTLKPGVCLTISSSEGVQAGGRGAARVMSRHTQLPQSHRPTQPSASSDSR